MIDTNVSILLVSVLVVMALLYMAWLSSMPKRLEEGRAAGQRVGELNQHGRSAPCAKKSVLPEAVNYILNSATEEDVRLVLMAIYLRENASQADCATFTNELNLSAPRNIQSLTFLEEMKNNPQGNLLMNANEWRRDPNVKPR